jgi:hypothetical protein|nr:MAG TPA_asm: hypothetical protein [Caudoviricetes sp.]
MAKIFKVSEAYIGNSEIEAYDDDDRILDIIVNDYNVEGACRVLYALGYMELKGTDISNAEN